MVLSPMAHLLSTSGINFKHKVDIGDITNVTCDDHDYLCKENNTKKKKEKHKPGKYVRGNIYSTERYRRHFKHRLTLTEH